MGQDVDVTVSPTTYTRATIDVELTRVGDHGAGEVDHLLGLVAVLCDGPSPDISKESACLGGMIALGAKLTSAVREPCTNNPCNILLSLTAEAGVEHGGRVIGDIRLWVADINHLSDEFRPLREAPRFSMVVRILPSPLLHLRQAVRQAVLSRQIGVDLRKRIEALRNASVTAGTCA